MRVNKWGVGVIIAAAVVLTGCSAGGADEPATSTPGSGASQETEAPSSDCPELKEGATIDGATLGECITAAMTDSAGFAATMSTLGIESTSRYSPADDAVATDSTMGSLVIIGEESWVKTSTGDWQVTDPASSDPVIAGLSMGAAAVDPSDPIGVASTLSGDFTVTGTGTRLGEDVYLLTGTAETQGATVEMVIEVTADYVSLATTATTEAEGQSIEAVQEVTEWDVKQDIVAPI